MRELIRDLLAYTQLTGEDPAPAEPVDLNLVFSKALENLKVAVEDSRASVTSDRLPAVLGRETNFIQLFQNLIGNALKYRGAQPPRIHVSAAEANGGWRIAVADNGMGIDPAHHQMIFGLFKRLHGRALSGTGIGLAVCKRVVQRYGGRIWVESRLNQGATFYFTLPAEKGREFDAAPGGLCAL